MDIGAWGSQKVSMIELTHKHITKTKATLKLVKRLYIWKVFK